VINPSDTFNVTQEQAAKVVKAFQGDPNLFLCEALGITKTWEGQQRIMAAIASESRVAVQSGNGLGKDYISSAIILWFLYNHIPSIVIATGPTSRQVEKVVWGELTQKFHAAKIPLGGRLLNNLLEVDKEQRWFAMGFTTKDIHNTPGRMQGFHCLFEDMEILTKRGWVGIDEISSSDLVLSVDLSSSSGEWMPIQNINKYPFDGDINVYDGRCVSFAVTDEHRFPTVKVFRGDKWKLTPLQNCGDRFYIKRSFSWIGDDFEVPEPFGKMSREEFAEIVGFWTGDGGTREHGHSGKFYESLFYQTKESSDGYLPNLLKKFKWTKARDYYAISNKHIAEWFISNVGRYQCDRVVPRILLDAKKSVIEAYLEGLWKADGSCGDGRKHNLYNTSKKLMDGVQELLLKLGKPSSIGVNRKVGDKCSFTIRNTCYTINYPNGQRDHVVFKKDIHKERVKGRVWCIETQYQTFVARRKGKVFVSGNSKNIFILFTEAQAMERAAWDQAETLMSSGNAKMLVIGNPLLSYGPFYEACQPKSGWKVIRLDGEDNPNYKVGREVIPGLCSKEWIDMMGAKYGTESPTYLSKVRGFFPKTSTDTFIEPQWVEWANTKGMDALQEDGPEVAGLDPSSYGSNKTILVRRKGMKVIDVQKYERKSTMETVGVVVKTLQKGAQTVFLDVTGVGTGIYDRLVELGFRQKVVAINFGGKPKESGWYPAGVRTPKDKYDDIATQMYDRLKGYLETRKMAFPYDEDLSIQLVNRKMKVQSSGRMKLESKKEFSARGYDSPDEADALALCFCEVDEGENVSPEPVMEVQEDKTLDAIFS
jgi:hypothetical protein